jgi:hypothetical protein
VIMNCCRHDYILLKEIAESNMTEKAKALAAVARSEKNKGGKSNSLSAGAVLVTEESSFEGLDNAENPVNTFVTENDESVDGTIDRYE